MLLYIVIQITTALACYLIGVLVGKKAARLDEEKR